MADFTDEQIRRFIAESNRIEGILVVRDVEIAEFKRFIALAEVHVTDLCVFVDVYQPGAKLRLAPGMDVRIGAHIPPPGGPHIYNALNELVSLANGAGAHALSYDVHIQYETLHPFTDGNGRSGRMLWYWMMRDRQGVSLGFLHAFYYQTLAFSRRGH